MEILGRVEGLVALMFLCRDRGIKFTCGNLLRRGMDKAEFAGGEVVFFGTHWWSEGSAEDGTMLVEVTGPGARVKHGAGLVIRELLEENGGLAVFAKNPSCKVAREPRVEAN